MSKSVERVITVAAPLSRVWAYLSDFTTTNEWDPGTVRTTLRTGDGGVGTTYHNTSKVAGREVELLYTVETFDPPHEISLRGENGSVRTIDRLRLTGDETTSTLTYTATFEPKGIARLFEPLLPLGMKKLADETEKSLIENLGKLG